MTSSQPLEYVSEIDWQAIKIQFMYAQESAHLKPFKTNRDHGNEMGIISQLMWEINPETATYLYEQQKRLNSIRKGHSGLTYSHWIEETTSFIRDNPHTYGSYNWFLDMISKTISKISLTDEDKSRITGIIMTFYNDMFEDDAYKMADIQDSEIKDAIKQCTLEKFFKIFYLLGAREEFSAIYWHMIYKKDDLPKPSIQIFDLMVKSIDIYDINVRINTLLMIFQHAKMVADDHLYSELFHKIAGICAETMENKIAAGITAEIILNEYIGKRGIKDFVIKAAVVAYDAINIRFTNEQWDIIKKEIWFL